MHELFKFLFRRRRHHVDEANLFDSQSGMGEFPVLFDSSASMYSQFCYQRTKASRSRATARTSRSAALPRFKCKTPRAALTKAAGIMALDLPIFDLNAM
jgi:hypothetical protein